MKDADIASKQVTRFSFARSRTFSVFPDNQRLYSDDHYLDIISMADDGRRLEFQVLDVPQRRWYEFNIPRDPSRPWQWLSETEETELRDMFTRSIRHQPQAYNSVRFDEDGNITYEFKQGPMGIPLRNQPILISSTFPIAQYVDITQKRYLCHAVDTCVWNGVPCTYKQIQFDPMVGTLCREIESRETLMHHFGVTDPLALSNRGINPILAIVVNGNPPLFCGILFAPAGTSLDKFSEKMTIQHFVSLITTVISLQDVGLEHGDICEGNVCIDKSVQLMNFGEKATEYINDIVATGRLMRLCVDGGRVQDSEAKICEAAAIALMEKQDLKSALSILENASVMESSAY